MSYASIPQHFWDYAMSTAVYLINRLPTPIFSYKSPFEILFHKSPYFTKLRVFRCACWPHLRGYNNHKLQPRSLLYIFLCYSSNHSCNICFHHPTNRIYFSNDVVFCENIFPLSSNVTSNLVHPIHTPTAHNLHTPRSNPLSPSPLPLSLAQSFNSPLCQLILHSLPIKVHLPRDTDAISPTCQVRQSCSPISSSHPSSFEVGQSFFPN